MLKNCVLCCITYNVKGTTSNVCLLIEKKCLILMWVNVSCLDLLIHPFLVDMSL